MSVTPHETGVAWTAAFAAHDRGAGAAFLPAFEYLPNERWDRPERMLCLYRVLSYSDDAVVVVQDFAPARVDEVLEYHTESYVYGLLAKGGRYAEAGFLAVGAVRELCRLVWSRKLRNAYALVRPAGHHAERNRAGGGCMFANGVLGALYAKRLGASRILYLDWDAHHGNSQQGAFWCDPTVLTISIHQNRRYPHMTGGCEARGEGPGFGANINVPVPPGSGGGVYRALFEHVVLPAAVRFRPDFVIVSSGLDANYIDPAARLSLHSEDYRWMTGQVVAIAEKYANGRLLFIHEGGYSLAYIPLCFLGIIEAMNGNASVIKDPFLMRWGTDFSMGVSVEARKVIDFCAALVDEVPSPSESGDGSTPGAQSSVDHEFQL